MMGHFIFKKKKKKKKNQTGGVTVPCHMFLGPENNECNSSCQLRSYTPCEDQ